MTENMWVDTGMTDSMLLWGRVWQWNANCVGHNLRTHSGDYNCFCHEVRVRINLILESAKVERES